MSGRHDEERARERAREQEQEQASKQASQQTNKQANKQPRDRGTSRRERRATDKKNESGVIHRQIDRQKARVRARERELHLHSTYIRAYSHWAKYFYFYYHYYYYHEETELLWVVTGAFAPINLHLPNTVAPLFVFLRLFTWCIFAFRMCICQIQ